MASTLAASPYGVQRREHHGFSQLPQPPPSPPVDEPRCSLPSISNLLDLADAGSPTSEKAPVTQFPSPRFTASGHHGRPELPFLQIASRRTSDSAKLSAQHRTLPPSPPMSTDASFDGHSPSSKSVSQFSNASAPSGYYHETTPPLDAAPRASHYSSHPGSAYYQPTQSSQAPISPLYYQRPLPQSFPPPPPPPSGANPWQHHHYMNPSHGAPFPQSQDRHVCPSCNKAFSRPSSLRIHSHSHTGEKPFKCPHSGCGKAFSVRSNMKRHERGCHSFEVGAGRDVLSA